MLPFLQEPIGMCWYRLLCAGRSRSCLLALALLLLLLLLLLHLLLHLPRHKVRVSSVSHI
jgi:hypothetical protein